MKKFIHYMTVLLTVCLCSIALTSCGDDDDDKKDGPAGGGPTGGGPTGTVTILGTWYSSYGDDSYTFNANGSVLVKEYDAQGNVSDQWTESYVFGNNVLTFIDEEGDVDTYAVVKLTANELVLRDEEGELEYYSRTAPWATQPEPPTGDYARKIVGTWVENESGATFTFNANGSYESVLPDEYGNMTDRDYGTWTISGNVVSIYESDGDVNDYTIISITNRTATLRDEYGYQFTLTRLR